MNRALMFGLVAVVLAALFGGFMVVGGPSYARMEKQDAQRATDLSRIHGYLQCSQVKQALPETLGVPDYCPTYWRVENLTDPATGMPYEYRRLDDTHFEICALFELKQENRKRRLITLPHKFEGKLGCIQGFTLPVE